MKKHLRGASLVRPAETIPAWPQSVPHFESYFGYSYIPFNPAGAVPVFNAIGGAAQPVYNFNPVVGVVGDFSANHPGRIGTVYFDYSIGIFQFGPRLSYGKKKTQNPYVQTLFGGIWGSPFPNVAPQFGGESPRPQASRQAKHLCPDGSPLALDKPCPKLQLPIGLHPSRSTIRQGETASLAPALEANHPSVRFQRLVNDQPVSQVRSFDFGTNGLEPGEYRVTSAAETSITVQEYKPLTGSLSPDPSEIYAGEKFSLNAQSRGQCGGPIRPGTFAASEGKVEGNQFGSSDLRFDRSVRTEQRKSVTITATAEENRRTAKAKTTFTAIQKPSAPVRVTDLLFPRGSARVKNCPNLAEGRARKAAAMITAGGGVCLSMTDDRLMLSARGGSHVAVWFLPSGAQCPEAASNASTAAALNVAAMGCPR